MPDFTVEQLNPRDLTPNPLNWRRHPQTQREVLAYSLGKFGFVQGVVLNKQTGNLIDGHARVEEAIEQGRETIPVNVVDLSEEDERELLRLFDPIGALAETDTEALDRLIAEIGNPDLEAMLQGIGSGVGGLLVDADPDAIPDQVETRCKPGDLWRLGEHRLLCGDSTVATDVERLMGNDLADVVATSPPYTDQREYTVGEFDWDGLMCGVSSALFPILADDAHVLINLGLSHKDRRVDLYWSAWLGFMAEAGYPLFGWYVWDKGSGMPGNWNGRLAPSHEFVFHFNRESDSANKWIPTTGESKKRGTSGKRFRQADGSLKELYSPHTIGQDFKVPDSVIRITREMARGIHTQNHPAVYPVEFASFLVQTWTAPGDVAYEPFAGSGTTLIACEQTGRVCRAMEVEPKYCDVILARWEQATGRTAELVDA